MTIDNIQFSKQCFICLILDILRKRKHRNNLPNLRQAVQFHCDINHFPQFKKNGIQDFLKNFRFISVQET